MSEHRLQHLAARVHGLIWSTRASDLDPLRRAGLLGLRIGITVARDLADGQLSLRAMSLVYTTLLSLVPLLAVSFSVLKAFGVHNQLQPALLNLLQPLGEEGVRVAAQIVGFVERVNVGVLGAAGLAVLIFTVVSLVQKIESAVNHTWRIARTRGFFERFSRYLSVILIGPVLIFTAMGVYASVESSELVRDVMQVGALGTLRSFVAAVLPYVLVMAAFTFVYVYIPNTRVRLGAALSGGVVAGALWVLAGATFAAFVVGSSSTAAIYSSFAVLVVFMIWVHLGWLILLIGAAVAFYVQHPQYLGVRPSQLRLGNRLGERLGLQLMLQVARNFTAGGAPWTISRLAAHLNVPVQGLQAVVERLVEARLLVRVDADEEAYVPARALDGIGVAEVLGALREAPREAVTAEAQVRGDGTVEALVERIDAAIGALCQASSLRDLLREEARQGPGAEPAAPVGGEAATTGASSPTGASGPTGASRRGGVSA